MTAIYYCFLFSIDATSPFDELLVIQVRVENYPSMFPKVTTLFDDFPSFKTSNHFMSTKTSCQSSKHVIFLWLGDIECPRLRSVLRERSLSTDY